MAVWALLSLALLSYCSGVRSQSVTQPASASASLGQTVKLSGTRSSGGSWGGYYAWYQQRPGQGPRLVHCGSGCSRGEGIPDRFTASYSGDNFYLTITNVQAEDEADYYCGDYESTGGYKYIFGGGTHLEVTTAGQPAVPPKVHLFPPSSEELTSKRKGTLVCLIDDFIPGAIDVTWLADGSPITSNVETTRPTKRNDKYVASSYLSLTAAEYEKKSEYTCKVTHDGKSYQKSVQREACSA
ncbi:immunoglobulin lambda-1 light chain-like isoform X2 [Hemicordylus capensis]|uniref:immunoglobulin lambda-1 light chain-like isoform X2 n=1 Tax=Hemicordylus capensis TaxID=884348 RepID=UPI002304013C|nr:immunoglobulin lambda-1 light chain-like isoform X2 [Hemicordylus capensis]